MAGVPDLNRWAKKATMPFDVEKMLRFSVTAITAFAKNHANETFYAFAIDASMLCLSSEECAAASLKQYQDDWERETSEVSDIAELSPKGKKHAEWLLRTLAKPARVDVTDPVACLAFLNQQRLHLRQKGCRYRTPEAIQALRENTGDWAYQGFAHLKSQCGFDDDLYQEHYDLAQDADDGHAPETEYAKAMTQLVSALMAADAFACLRRTGDFKASWVDHDY